MGNNRICVPPLLQFLVWIFWACTSLAQISPAEHSAHHPGPTGAAPTGTNAPGTPGMMEGMGDMMKGMMGAPAPKDLYPSLMALPQLTPEQRRQVDEQAMERMRAGSRLMAQALDRLNASAPSNNYSDMQQASVILREGLAQFDSGVAARRALAEGKPPQSIALAWFKREMNLQSPTTAEQEHSKGLSLFHLFTMALLIAFAFAMLAMYYFKMRRAVALFGRIESDAGSPPPGSAPPLA